jgi:hypothetical protein
LGYPWFKAFNPEIDWTKGMLVGPQVKIETPKHQDYQEWKHAQEVQVNRISSTQNWAIKVAQEAGEVKTIIPAKYKAFKGVFDEAAADRFPPN